MGFRRNSSHRDKATAPAGSHAASGNTHLRNIVLSTLLACGLAALCFLSLAEGPYLDKFARKHTEIGVASGHLLTFASNLSHTGDTLPAAIDANMPYAPSPAQIDQLPEASGLEVFSMNPATRNAPALTSAEQAAIEAALEYFDKRGSVCSCLVVDLGTGHGIGSNYDARVYGASAFKGVVAAYVCEVLIDNGSYELGGSLQSLIESSVRWSDNDAYRTLKSGYANGLASWVTSMGVDPTYVSRYRFPTYSAQESTALWAHIASYLDSRSEAALWLGEQLSLTNVSPIRDAVEAGLADGSLLKSIYLSEGNGGAGFSGADGGLDDGQTSLDGGQPELGGGQSPLGEGQSLLERYGASVQNKAGWISGSYNSTVDAGLVHLDGHTYAISIMTSAPDSEASREAVSQLALELLRAIR